MSYRTAYGGNNREDREREIREQFEWVEFGGEYHPWQLVAAGLDTTFGSGGQITEHFTEKQAKELMAKVAKRIADESKKSPIASGIMSFTTWETPLGTRVNLGDQYVPYVGVLKTGGKAEFVKPPKPQPRGYQAFRTGIDQASQGKSDFPGLTSSIESQWIRYICTHCLNNADTREAYKEFRRRLDVAYQYRYEPKLFAEVYGGNAFLDLETIPPAIPEDSKVGALIKKFVWHCVDNPGDEKGYREFHRRVREDLYPNALKLMPDHKAVENCWLKCMMWHLAANPPVIEQ